MQGVRMMHLRFCIYCKRHFNTRGTEPACYGCRSTIRRRQRTAEEKNIGTLVGEFVVKKITKLSNDVRSRINS